MIGDFPRGFVVKNQPANAQKTQVWSLGQEDPLEEEMATLSSILVWRIPWTEEPGGLQSIGSQRVRHTCTQWMMVSRFFDSITHFIIKLIPDRLRLKCIWRAFPGGPAVKSPPCDAGSTGSIPGWGSFHMPQSNWAHVPQLLSLVL